MRDVAKTYQRKISIIGTGDSNGAALIIFTIFLVPMIFLVGAGVDYARALVVKQRLVNAADAVAIASWPRPLTR